ncbi:heparan-sulfate 6-O-sulfotransferase 2-like [Corticium candelabrum]|uniref:heparan-sulfate 6-O-sulfotransferase 2-like n=1 Tax=Corticium candelabrum TaxID=121492 RepID=UPI002E2552A5|nr:heparan-sulfate 6-O-sulfotransferase 2-like [Corticium candelabrum]
MKSRKAIAWVLSIASVFTGCVLVWISTSFRLYEASGKSFVHELTQPQHVEISRRVPPRIPRDFYYQRGQRRQTRGGRYINLPPSSSQSRDRKSGVRIFWKSGRLLFSPTISNQQNARRVVDSSRTRHAVVSNKKSVFSFETDVLVFLHIQKTGGTALELHLLDIQSRVPCVCDGVTYVYSSVETRSPKRCECPRGEHSSGEQWLFSRFTFSWICGVHADWTQLVSCVPKIFETRYGAKQRTFLIFTILRQPVDRFLSEYEHVARGANWAETIHHTCRGSKQNHTSCYSFSQHKQLSIDSFLNCPWNLAINRQSRMLANMTEMSDCYHEMSRTVSLQEALLVRAKENLLKIDFFGLSEFQIHTQLLFEKTFGLHFGHRFEQMPLDRQHAHKHNVSNEVRGEVARVNRLDMYLYRFAKSLFLQRLEKFEISKTGLKFT